MIQLLPSSYNQTRNVMMNYEVLGGTSIKSRKDHKLDEWRSFYCKWVEELPYSELIIETAVSLEVGRICLVNHSHGPKRQAKNGGAKFV